MNGRLFIVSNRMPLAVERQNSEVVVRPSSGGLVSAISSYLNQPAHMPFQQVFWAGVPDVGEKLWRESSAKRSNEQYTYMPVFIGRTIYDAYYNGFSNSVLWPLFHYFPSYIECDPEYFEAYMAVNRQFSDRLVAEVRPGDVVWIHDYHLLPLAAMLRERVQGITIGLFLHIPFPSHELLRIIPRSWQRALLSGMLGADLIGFHTRDYADHFMNAVRMLLKTDTNDLSIAWMSRKVKAGVFPIGIDFNRFHTALSDDAVAASRDKYRSIAAGRKLIFSVDRLDYTKGILNRLRGYQLFLDQHPEYREQVVFALIVVPSRDTISKYSERKKSIDEYIGQLNSRSGSIGWQPVLYQYGHLSFEELTGLYTACNLALITPLRDGMNLVAKEFVASRSDQQGVLVLSEMAGASNELSDALLINPNDEQEMADMILKGLQMSADEQSRRMQAMQRRISSYDVNHWAQDFFQQLDETTAFHNGPAAMLLDAAQEEAVLIAYKEAGRRMLLLDYDGTLVDFCPHPSEARPDAALLELLHTIGSAPDTCVYIISGRDAQTLDSWLGHLPLGLIAEHGAAIKQPGGEWKLRLSADSDWKPDARVIFEDACQRCPGSFIETKAHSLAWHYRNADSAEADSQAAALVEKLQAFAQDRDLDILSGNKVVELRRGGIHKGAASLDVVLNETPDFTLAIGDDRTDEDMFAALPRSEAVYTVKVGNGSTAARYRVDSSIDIIRLLGRMAADIRPQEARWPRAEAAG